MVNQLHLGVSAFSYEGIEGQGGVEFDVGLGWRLEDMVEEEKKVEQGRAG